MKSSKFSMSMNVIAIIAACGIFNHAGAQQAEMPKNSDFQEGEHWVWVQIDSRTQLEEGKRYTAVVNEEGILKFAFGANQENKGQISARFIRGTLENPWRAWPLTVGKKWVYQDEFIKSNGTKINIKQDVEVVAFEEVTVPAGKFKVFKIQYQGFFNNSKGGNGKISETYWFAPEVKMDIKYQIDDGYNKYYQELISYTHKNIATK